MKEEKRRTQLLRVRNCMVCRKKIKKRETSVRVRKVTAEKTVEKEVHIRCIPQMITDWSIRRRKET